MKVKTTKGEAYLKVKGIDWEGKSPSKLQKSCKDVLRDFWQGDMISEEQPIPKTRMRFDFINFSKKIIIEADGEQHRKYNKFMHNNNIYNFIDSMKRDDSKEIFAALNGFTLFRVKNASELREILIGLM